MSPKENQDKTSQHQMDDHEPWWVEAAKTIGLSIVLAFGIRTFVAEARYIPSSSMEPTLQIHDRLLVGKLGYYLQTPKRGDIVVFRAPATAGRCTNPQAVQPVAPRDAFIKRVIGLPGEKVEVQGARVFINGQPLAENYIDTAPLYTYGPTTVPEDSYLVLGDNRNNSCDSHQWGFVPRKNIIGQAVIRFWPLNRLGAIAPTPAYQEVQ